LFTNWCIVRAFPGTPLVLSFLPASDWDPVSEQFGAMPFIYGTLVSSLVALIIAVPLSGRRGGVYHRNVPKALRGPLSFFVELLAAIPSVIYGVCGPFSFWCRF
jgi:phosphate transport system permease protein